MSNISVVNRDSIPVEEQAIEFVERKGMGHPDSLIDGICDRVSIELSKAYIEKAGRVLHHNVDKGLIVGGKSEASFGHGKILRPIEVIVAGRAVKELNGIKIPVDQIAIDTTKAYLKEHTRYLDVDSEVIVNTKIDDVSADLNQVYERSKDVPLANDTSFGIGFAPFSETERLTLETEHMLNSKEYKVKMPAVGEDIKVMAVREGNKITLTIAIAFVAQEVRDIKDYVEKEKVIANDVMEFAKTITKREVDVSVNTGDDIEKGEVYLTKTGLSCESGDDGSVGRGNRVNGLITPFRNMSLEAAAGKNPISHVGKIYNILAKEIAQDVSKLYPQVEDCRVYIVSQIGRSIADPKSLCVEIVMKKGEDFDSVSKKIREVADNGLENLAYLTQEIINGEHEVF
ncbi:MAG TPA: methionine adenosyltransferase [Candidatus Baltobacteraceae bacterium]|nr:methionine adenosyltransferase [Candidatus Baltobacteraceae bacterium]